MNSSPQRGNSNGSQQQSELQRIESLCNTLYNGDNPQQQQDAQAQLNLLQSSVSQIPLCQYVLDNSQNPYAILVASEALTKLVTNSWNHFKTAQRIVIRDYLLSFLGKNDRN
jgi:exportin-7